jgi:hypothetical protein
MYCLYTIFEYLLKQTAEEPEALNISPNKAEASIIL